MHGECFSSNTAMSQMAQDIEGHDPGCILSSAFSVDARFSPKAVYRNLSPAKLYEKALAYEPNTHITSSGSLATTTGSKTGRSPLDKRLVREPGFEEDVWWGEHSPNYEMDERAFLMNREAAVDYLSTLDRVYVVDGYANWDPECRMKIRVICGREHHALFAHNMMLRPTQQELQEFGEPDFVIWNAGAFAANRYNPYMQSRTSICTSLKHKEVVILGTEYAGEMKKGVFTLLHYYMPHKDVLFLHSGCNIGKAGDVALFLGLSGTGKTTLSIDPSRPLIGDDEHCWGPNGVFNIEAGCYAKCVNLRPDTDPDMFSAVNRFGTMLENVVYDQHHHQVDFSNMSLTENMRACFPITHMRNVHIPCMGGHPRNVILLCCDALGVLPAVSKLSVAQAMYHFVSGYTAKVAGTEVGVCSPEPTFSACYAGAFIMWHPMKYAVLLGDKLRQAGTTAWLVNTGWQGGKPGVGTRIKLQHTRAIVDAIHSGELSAAHFQESPIFELQVPTLCPGVPPGILQPEKQWQNPHEFRITLNQLASMFTENFRIFIKDGSALVGEQVMEFILSGGPNPVNQQLQIWQQQQQGGLQGLVAESQQRQQQQQHGRLHHLGADSRQQQQKQQQRQQHQQQQQQQHQQQLAMIAESSEQTAALQSASNGLEGQQIRSHTDSEEHDLQVHLSVLGRGVKAAVDSSKAADNKVGRTGFAAAAAAPASAAEH